MSDEPTDIVTRLRGHIAITTRIHFAKDGYPEPVYVHGLSPICQEAANEIERLRQERNAFEAERDEARREVCSMNETGLRMNESDKKREAKRRGWDCFKEKP